MGYVLMALLYALVFSLSGVVLATYELCERRRDQPLANILVGLNSVTLAAIMVGVILSLEHPQELR